MQTLLGRFAKYWTLALPFCVSALMLLTATENAACAHDEVEVMIAGSVVDAAGKPAVGAKVSLCRHSQQFGQGKLATVDSDGKFSVAVVADSKSIEAMHIECKSADGSEIGYRALRAIETKLDLKAIALKLDAVKKARLLVLDDEEKAVSGATAIARLGDAFGRVVKATTDESGVADFTYTDSEPIGLAFVWKDNLGFDYRFYQPEQQGVGQPFPSQKPERFKLSGAKPIKLRLVDDLKQPLKGIKVYPFSLSKSPRINLRSSDLNLSFFLRYIQKQTDANGEVSFEWLPEWQKGRIAFMSSGGEGIFHSTLYVDPSTVRSVQEIQFDRMVAIRGNVVDPDGKPVKGITVSASGASLGAAKPFDAQTDEKGNYELLVAPKQMYMVIVKDKRWGSTPQQGFAVQPNTPVEGKDFKLRKATRIFGKVRTGFWLTDVPNHRVVITQVGRPISDFDIELPDPEPPRKLDRNARPSTTFEAWTDAKGNFEFFVGDGDFYRSTDGQGDEFKISGEESFEMNFTINAKVAAQSPTDTSAPLLGLIVDDKNGQPIRDCNVTIVPRGQSQGAKETRPTWEAKTDEEGKFRAERVRTGSYIHALSSDKKLGAIMEITRNQNVFAMKLKPVGSATGRLLSADGSKPLADQRLGSFYMVPAQRKEQLGPNDAEFGTPGFVVDCTTDAKGQFRFEHLVPNVEYRIYTGPAVNVRAPLTTFKVEPGEEVDLGDLKSK